MCAKNQSDLSKFWAIVFVNRDSCFPMSDRLLGREAWAQMCEFAPASRLCSPLLRLDVGQLPMVKLVVLAASLLCCRQATTTYYSRSDWERTN